MRKTLVFPIVFFIIWGCSHQSSELKTSDSNLLLFKIVEASRIDLEEFKKMVTIDLNKFEIEKIDTPEWGHDEWWYLNDKETLLDYGLKSLTISIEQNKFRAIYYTMIDVNFSDEEQLNRNLRYVGLEPNLLSNKEWGYVINDINGFRIVIRDLGSFYECFEHHPGH